MRWSHSTSSGIRLRFRIRYLYQVSGSGRVGIGLPRFWMRCQAFPSFSPYRSAAAQETGIVFAMLAMQCSSLACVFWCPKHSITQKRDCGGKAMHCMHSHGMHSHLMALCATLYAALCDTVWHCFHCTRRLQRCRQHWPGSRSWEPN